MDHFKYWSWVALAASLWANSAGAAPANILGDFKEPLTITNLYTGADGLSHVREGTIPSHLTPNGFTSLFDDSAVRARLTYVPDGDRGDYHTATPTHLTFLLQGDYIIYFGNNEQYRLKPGTVLFAEDGTGKGHAALCDAKTEKKICLFLIIDPKNVPKSIKFESPTPKK